MQTCEQLRDVSKHFPNLILEVHRLKITFKSGTPYRYVAPIQLTISTEMLQHWWYRDTIVVLQKTY